MATKSAKSGSGGPWDVPRKVFFERVVRSLEVIEDELALVRRAIQSAQREGDGAKTIRIPIGPPLVGIGCEITRVVNPPISPAVGPKAKKIVKPGG